MNRQCLKQFLDAARDGNTFEVKALIDAGADVNITSDGISALHLAVWNNDWEMVKILIGAGANINFIDEYGWAPLHYVARDGPTDILKVFIDAGADVNITSGGKSTLDLAVWHNKWEMVKILIDAGANVDYIDGSGWAPLHYVAKDGPIHILKVFIDAGADVNITSDRKSALNLAAWQNKWEMVKILIDAGANVNFIDSNTWSPLFYAAKDGSVDVILLFIKAGANLHIFDQNGLNPINLADEPNRIECGKVLIKYAILKHGSILLNHPISTELSEFRKKCVEEIKEMKQIKLKCCESLYKYLIETDENNLALFLSEENVDIKNNFSKKYLKPFSVYADDLESQLKRGCKRAHLLYESMDCFSKKLPEDVRRKISELLTNEDLEKFLLCMKINANSKVTYFNVSVFIDYEKFHS